MDDKYTKTIFSFGHESTEWVHGFIANRIDILLSYFYNDTISGQMFSLWLSIQFRLVSMMDNLLQDAINFVFQTSGQVIF